jgi:hypothetical protein
MNNDSLIGSLFDFSFTSFITPKLAKILYALLLLGSAIAGVAVLVSVFSMGSGFIGKVGGLIGGVIGGAIVSFVCAVYSRASVELLMVVFRGVDYLAQIRESVRK